MCIHKGVRRSSGDPSGIVGAVREPLLSELASNRVISWGSAPCSAERLRLFGPSQAPSPHSRRPKGGAFRAARMRFTGELLPRQGAALPQSKRRSRRSMLDANLLFWTGRFANRPYNSLSRSAGSTYYCPPSWYEVDAGPFLGLRRGGFEQACGKFATSISMCSITYGQRILHQRGILGRLETRHAGQSSMTLSHFIEQIQRARTPYGA